MWAGAVTVEDSANANGAARECKHDSEPIASYLGLVQRTIEAIMETMPDADTSGASCRPLYAEPTEAHKLIAQSAQTGAQAPTTGAVSSSLPGAEAGSSPFDAVVQAAKVSLSQEDVAAAGVTSASSTTHAGGSEAAVTGVSTTDTQSASQITEVQTQIPLRPT